MSETYGLRLTENQIVIIQHLLEFELLHADEQHKFDGRALHGLERRGIIKFMGFVGFDGKFLHGDWSLSNWAYEHIKSIAA